MWWHTGPLVSSATFASLHHPGKQGVAGPRRFLPHNTAWLGERGSEVSLKVFNPMLGCSGEAWEPAPFTCLRHHKHIPTWVLQTLTWTLNSLQCVINTKGDMFCPLEPWRHCCVDRTGLQVVNCAKTKYKHIYWSIVCPGRMPIVFCLAIKDPPAPGGTEFYHWLVVGSPVAEKLHW